jgi:ATP-dependent DNA helicase RecQ
MRTSAETFGDNVRFGHGRRWGRTYLGSDAVSARSQWIERDRRGWETFATLIGGSLRGIDLRVGLPLAARRGLDQAWVAHNFQQMEPASPDVAYWATVCRKILQRGTAPPVSPRVEQALLTGFPAPDTPADPASLIAAVIGPHEGHVDLDPRIELHPQWERPFWSTLGATCPEMLRWVLPQAPLEPLAHAPTTTQRWVDFLVAVPWADDVVVIELDGSGHERRLGVDRDRDKLLHEARVRVARHPGADGSAPAGPLFDILRDIWKRRPPVTTDGVLMQLLHGPAAVHRFAFAVVEAVEAGVLNPNRPWAIQVDDPLGIIEIAGACMFDLLSSVGSLWGIAAVPTDITVNGIQWRRDDQTGRYERGGGGGSASPDLSVVLDPFSPPHARLPTTAIATTVVRGACLPVDLAWRPPTRSERRNIRPSRETDLALEVLVNDVFDHQGFRPGQLEALNQVLAGGDCLALLPTGAGKSLIYQLAGLLRPGITIAVDPIVALINDQERRLRSDGIDRVAGLHAAKLAQARTAIFETVAEGDVLFVFLTPERLQSAEFRLYLRQAAAEQLINLVVVDEAHCVSEWGHDFRTSYLFLGRNLRNHARGDDDLAPPLLALTGTASPGVLRDALRELQIDPDEPGALQRPADFDRPNLHYRVRTGSPERLGEMLEHAISEDIAPSLECTAAELGVLKGPATRSGLVFVPHTSGAFGVMPIARQVRAAIGVADKSRVDVYSGGQPKEWAGDSWDDHKAEVAERFKNNEIAVLVSTKAFGMGIDKPNIRWTVHVGFPSSIEAFAQEAGRAGRNGRDAICVLGAFHPSPERATELLDLKRDRDERRALWRNDRWAKDDLQKQLFFLFNSFPSEEEERRRATAMWQELLAAGAAPTLMLAVPRLPAESSRRPQRDREQEIEAREKAIYRLVLAGVIYDYTIEYQANTFTIEFADFNSGSIDAAVIDYARRVEPGRTRVHRERIASAPSQLDQRVEHHLATVISILYRVIEPARVVALRGIYRLTLGDPDDTAIRATINSYLGEGPIATILAESLGHDAINVSDLIRALERTPPANPYEWSAAAQRQLDSYGPHPALYVAQALGEAWKPDRVADEDEFARISNALFGMLTAYAIDEADAVTLMAWMLAQLRNQIGGQRWSWTPRLWNAWDQTQYRDIALLPIERRVATEALVGNLHPAEIEVLVKRRTRRVAVEVAAFAERLTTAPTIEPRRAS